MLHEGIFVLLSVALLCSALFIPGVSPLTGQAIKGFASPGDNYRIAGQVLEKPIITVKEGCTYDGGFEGTQLGSVCAVNPSGEDKRVEYETTSSTLSTPASLFGICKRGSGEDDIAPPFTYSCNEIQEDGSCPESTSVIPLMIEDTNPSACVLAQNGLALYHDSYYFQSLEICNRFLDRHITRDPTNDIRSISFALFPGTGLARATAQVIDSTALQRLSGSDSCPRTTTTVNRYVWKQPNWNQLLSISEFSQEESVSITQIRDWINSKPSRLKSLTFTYDGEEHDFAEYVKHLSREYDVNPLLILARIQVESSRIESGRALPSSLTGCGFNDRGSRASGQRASVAGQLKCTASTYNKWYHHEPIESPMILQKAGRRVSTRIDNAATYSLYMYTPHLCTQLNNQNSCNDGGNYLFMNYVWKYHLEITGEHSDSYPQQ